MRARTAAGRALALGAALAALAAGCAPPPRPGAGAGAVPYPVRPDWSDLMDNGCDGGGDGVDWEFQWSPVPRAVRYHLQAWSVGPGSPALDDSTITGNFYRRSEPRVFVRESMRIGWRWRVRAFADGAWSEWSRETVFDFEPPGTDCP